MLPLRNSHQDLKSDRSLTLLAVTQDRVGWFFLDEVLGEKGSILGKSLVVVVPYTQTRPFKFGGFFFDVTH